MSGEKKSGTNIKMIYWLTAALVFGLLCVLTFPDRQRELSREEYPVVILGDSLVGLCRDETSVPELLSNHLGQRVFNGAFGGTCLAVQPEETSTNYTAELLNMVSLSKAIVADDFGVQQTVRSRRVITDYFGDTVDELECVDFQKVEVLLLVFGLNDYHAGIPLENADNPLDESTYGGALRSVLTSLRQVNPNMRIVLVTPTYTWYLSEHLTCEEYDTGEFYLEDYVEKEKEIGEAFGVEVIDLYHGLYTHENWKDWKIYTEDGLHPNEDARRMIAQILSETIAGDKHTVSRRETGNEDDGENAHPFFDTVVAQH